MNALPHTRTAAERLAMGAGAGIRFAPHRAAPPEARRGAFTLLELMVVVAIVSLLAAVLLSSLRVARTQALQVSCTANLRSLAGAWQVYLVDSRGLFLQSVKARDNVQLNFGGKQGSSAVFRVRKPLNRYLGLGPVVPQAEVFRCPADTGGAWMRPTAYDYYGTSYLMNHMLVGQSGLVVKPKDTCAAVLGSVSRRLKGLNVSQVATPALLLLSGDHGWYPAWSSAYLPEDHAEWHGRRMHHNLAFMDGHASPTRVRKDLHTTSLYTLIPFRELQVAATACQVEVNCD